MDHGLRIALFVLTITLLTAGMCTYVWGRLGRTFGLGRVARLGLAALMASGVVAMVGARLLRGDPALADPIGVYGSLVTLTALIATVLLVPWEPLWWWRRRQARRKQPRAPAPHGTEGAPAAPERRDFLAQTVVGLAASASASATLYGTFFGRHDYQIETVPIALPRLPRALDGFRIVQLSDLHIGLFVGEPELRAALDRVRQMQPDLIVLTGDLLDNDARYADQLGQLTRRLGDHARHGVAAILGNHDHYAGAAAVKAALQGGGAHLLHNRALTLPEPGLVIAGVDDVRGPRFGDQGPRLDQAFAQADPDHARVLLCHNPSYYPTSRQHVDLQLSGHTHGGQITLFVNPAELVLRHGFVRGHYRVGDSQLYVNRGFGTAGPPARVGSPPEITQIVLTT